MSSEKAKIVQLGDPILHNHTHELTAEEIRSAPIQDIIQTMRQTLHGIGVGLAAPQIGYPLKIAVIEDLQEFIDRLPIEVQIERERRAIPFHVLINPKITWRGAEDAYFFEACLSVSDCARITPRAKKVCVEYLDEHGIEKTVMAEGWYARILQHEIGHLNGKLFLDVSDPRMSVSMQEYKDQWLFSRAKEIKDFFDSQSNA